MGKILFCLCTDVAAPQGGVAFNWKNARYLLGAGPNASACVRYPRNMPSITSISPITDRNKAPRLMGMALRSLSRISSSGKFCRRARAMNRIHQTSPPRPMIEIIIPPQMRRSKTVVGATEAIPQRYRDRAVNASPGLQSWKVAANHSREPNAWDDAAPSWAGKGRDGWVAHLADCLLWVGSCPPVVHSSVQFHQLLVQYAATGDTQSAKLHPRLAPRSPT